MAFGSQRMDFGCIYNYEDAVRTWENTTPWRGEENSSSRPLCTPYGKRKRQHSIIMYDDSVACELYSTDVVTFHKDGRMVLKTGGWDTNTTRAFMNAAQQYSVFAHLGNTYVRIDGKDYLIPSSGIEIKNGVVLNPQQEVVMRVNRAKSKVVLKNISGFEKYLYTLNALAKGDLDMSKISIPQDDKGYNLRALIQSLDEEGNVIPEELYPTLLAKIVREYSSGRNRLMTVASRFRDLVYAMTDAIEEAPVEIGSLPPKQKWSKHLYAGFL